MLPGVGAYFGAECQKRGMLVRVAGDSIMMSPPLIISPEEIDEVNLRFLSHSSDKFCDRFPSFYSSPSLGVVLLFLAVNNYLRGSIESYGREGKRTQDSAKEVRSKVTKTKLFRISHLSPWTVCHLLYTIHSSVICIIKHPSLIPFFSSFSPHECKMALRV